MTTDVLEPPVATASAAGGSEAEAGARFSCPQCSFSSGSEVGLKIHWRKQHKDIPEPTWTERPRTVQEPPAGATASAIPKLASERGPKELEGIRKELEDSLSTLGGLVFVFGLQTTGVVLGNRAERASYQAMVYAQRNESVMRAIVAFNAVMGMSELGKLASDVAMGLAVDVGAAHPAKVVHLGPVRVPGFVFLQPIAQDMAQVAAIHEQAEQLRQQFEREQAARQPANGRPADAPAGQ